jgi:hypothetical protein
MTALTLISTSRAEDSGYLALADVANLPSLTTGPGRRLVTGGRQVRCGMATRRASRSFSR